MAIYSTDLGKAAFTDTGVTHNLYTVPLSGGPAVIRSFSCHANGGAGVIVFLAFPGGPTTYLVLNDNTTGASGKLVTATLYQPIPPGTIIQAQQYAAAALFWNVTLGGYQFSTP